MADPQPTTPDGIKYVQDLRGAGFTDDEITAEKGTQSDDMAKAGFSAKEIKDYWGQKEPDMGPVKTQVTQRIRDQMLGADGKPKHEPIDADAKPVDAQNVWEAMAAGFGNSVLGLKIFGEKPPIQVPDTATTAQNLAQSAGQFLGDSPAMLIGGEVGGLPGAFAAPAAIRKILIDHYNSAGEGSLTPSEIAKRIVGTTWEAAKGAATGYAAGAVGANMAVANVLGGPITKALTSTAPKLLAENAAMTTVSSALEGHLPHYKEFLNSSIMIFGLHGMSAGIPKLMNIYENTGARPSDVADMLEKDPHLKGELLSDATDLPAEAKKVSPEEVAAPPPTPEEPPKAGGEPEEKSPEQLAKEEIISRKFVEPEETEKSLFEKIKSGTADLWGEVKTDSRDAYVRYFDKTAGLKDMVDKIGPGKLDEENSYVLSRFFGAQNDVVGHFFNIGTIDPETNDVNGESLKDIYDDHRKTHDDPDLGNVEAYLMAKRSLELDSRGISQPGDRANDKTYVDAHPELEHTAKRLVDFQNRVLNYARGKGLISEEQQKRFVEKNTYYLPLAKVLDAESAGGGPGKLSSLKAIGDSTAKIRNPLETLRQNTEMLIKAADENQIKAQAHKDMLAADHPEDFLEGVEKTKEPLVEGLDKEGSEAVNMLRRSGDDSTFSYRDKGQLVTVKVKDPGIAEVLNSFSDNYEGMNLFTRMFRTAASAVRFGTIQNPLTGFFLRHAIRNQEQAAAFSKTGLLPFQAVGGLFGKDEPLWNQALRDGALVTGIDASPEAFYTDTMENLDKKMPTYKKVWNYVDSTLAMSHAFIIANDNNIRMQEYSRSLDQGKSRTEAAMNARNVLADFQKEGLKRSFLQSTKAFFKAHYQGQFQLGGTFKDLAQGSDAEKSAAMGVLAKNIAWVTVPSVLLSLAQHDDQRVDDLQGWLRDGYHNLHLPWWQDADLATAMSRKDRYTDEVRQKDDGSYQVNNGYVFRFPKPFANGMFFGTAVQEALRAFKKNDPSEFTDFLGRVAGTMLVNPIPTVAQPFLEQAVNRNMFSNQALVRSDSEKRLPELRYDAYTSEFAKFLGAKISAVPFLRNLGPKDAPLGSPAVIQNYINAFSGGSGKYILQGIDHFMGKSNVPAPEWEWSDVPFVREFIVRHDMTTDSVTKFEARQDFANQVQASIKFLAKSGDYDGATKLEQQYSRNMDRLSGSQEAIHNMKTTIFKIQAAKSPDVDPAGGLTGVQKRQLINGLTDKIIGLARDGNKIMDKMEDGMPDGRGK